MSQEQFCVPKYHYPAAAKMGFDNWPFLRVFYWPFIKPDGSAGIQSRAELWPGSHVIALDHKTHEIYLIRRHRDTPQGRVLVTELPNGGLNFSATPYDTAIKELEEEAGIRALDETDWVRLTPDQGVQPIDGLVITHQHAFLCLRGKVFREPEDGETEEVLTVTWGQFFAMDDLHEFNDPMTLAFGWKAYRWLEKNRPNLIIH